MSISLNANFELLSAGLYLDARQQFNTIIEMKDFAETSIPDGFITYNKETQKHYVFNSSNTVDTTLGKWREYNSGDSSSTTYATWNSNVDYKVGNVVLKDEVRYSCIADHTSTDFETDSINWVVVLEQYYHVTQEQYNKMVSDGLITDSTKDLYIIDGNNEDGNSFSASYTTLDELGLTADATFQDVIDTLPKGGSALLGVTEFTNYQTIFPYEEGNDQFARVHIVKGTADGSRMYARWFRKDGAKEAIAIFNINDNKFNGWRLLKNRQTYTSLTELGLTADATIDDVIGALKDGETAIITTNEFTDYLTMFPNYCDKDQYAILKVEKKNDNRCFIEWRQKDGNAYAIGGLLPSNAFSDWNNLVRFKKDGFADDSIVCIGDTVSPDGTIQTLANLGFSNDILTWDTGVYRVSHVSGLTNLPSDITSTAPSFRLEHYNIKKWGANHNPHNNTWAQRHSFLYPEGGNVYHRFYECGNEVGTYIKDTGWQQIITENSKTDPYSCTGYTVLTGTEDLFTLPCGHYATTKADTAYNYPITDSSNLTANIYVLGCLNDPTNNKGYRIILYFDNKDRMYRVNEWWGNFSNGWQKIQTSSTKVTAPFNSKTFKLDITKGNENWNGNMKFAYCVDESYGEIIISSLGKTEVMWDCSTGVRYVKSVTYTIDPNNKAHITIGVELYDTVYGIHQLETVGDFAKINSFTGDAFTGTSVAKRGATRGRNNGVGILCDVADLGLTTPCTTVQIAQAMRGLANSMNRIPASGMIGVFDNGGNKITDAPSEYGLLQINAYGYDRVMIRYDGIASSSYTGSWIGQIKGSGGTFSSITWLRIDNNTYSTTEQAIGTWINGKTIYRKVIQYTFTSDVTGVESQTTIGSVPGLDTLIKAEATIKRLDVKYDYHVPYGKNAQNHGYIVANTSSGSAGSIILYDSAHSVNDIIYAIIEYTKQ